MNSISNTHVRHTTIFCFILSTTMHIHKHSTRRLNNYGGRQDHAGLHIRTSLSQHIQHTHSHNGYKPCRAHSSLRSSKSCKINNKEKMQQKIISEIFKYDIAQLIRIYITSAYIHVTGIQSSNYLCHFPDNLYHDVYERPLLVLTLSSQYQKQLFTRQCLLYYLLVLLTIKLSATHK